ncbi:MAG: sulfite exporter TauE/SafE family protein [Alphaproteobacteria bacterium]|nr:MAG: sulfite exporter TauE/SafE family protein [Alphaproteobacteria bacterium]
MEILGYIAAFIMGLTLGSLGGGGSILTVPILVYLMDVPPVTATGYSLLIVGAAAAFGALRYYRQGLVNVRAAVTFAVPSVVAVYLTRAFLMPAIPDPLVSAPVTLGKDMVIMVLFATLMVAAAVMMLRNSRKLTPPKEAQHPVILLVIEGAVVGVVTGILGAGGGFLIVPALVLLIGMPMKEAVGASLLIIALKSLIGFIGDLQAGIALQFPMLAIFFVATFTGMWAATRLSGKFDGKKMQKFFAYFTLAVAAVIVTMEIWTQLQGG